MRYRVDEYRIWVYNTVIVAIKNLPSDITLEKQSGSDELTTASARKVTEALRLVLDETAGEVFCSSMQKSKVKKCYGSGTYQSYSYAFYIEFDIPADKTIDNTDQFTIEMDWGEAPSDLAKEATLGDVAGVLDYIEQGGMPSITAIAKQGSNASATLTATQAALIDGNDTAISVGKEIRSEVGTGSDTAAETGTLSAVLKWTKNKVKDIYNALTDSTNGLSAIKTSAANAASDAAAAKTAAQGITGYALQGSDATATNTAIATLIGYTIQEIDGV